MEEAVEVVAGVDVVEVEIVEKCERKIDQDPISFLLYYHHVFVFFYISWIGMLVCLIQHCLFTTGARRLLKKN